MAVLRKWFGSKESASEKQLLHRLRGDRTRFERLIQLELMHRPGISRAAGAQAALDRWGARCDPRANDVAAGSP